MAKRKPQGTSELLDQQPPRNLEAESAVIASILHRPACLDDVSPILRPKDFYDDDNGIVFSHLLALHQSGKRPDMKLLKESLIQAGAYDRLGIGIGVGGGGAYFGEVMRSVPTAANVVHYAEIVRDRSTLRGIIGACTEGVRIGYDVRTKPDEALSTVENLIFQVRDERSAGCENLLSSADLLQHSMQMLEKRERGEFDQGIPTGFTDLDEFVSLRKQNLIIIAGRPSNGKTAFALNLVANVSVRNAFRTLFVSIEQSAEDIADRLIGSVARVNTYALRDYGAMSTADKQKVTEALADIGQGKIDLDCTATRRVADIGAVARRIARKSDLDLIVVDYLQLIEPSDRNVNREQQVSTMSRGLKMLARELNLPVVVLAQLNRQSENAKDFDPKLHHLRESGSIEQDADLVMFVHRPEIGLTPGTREHVEAKGKAKLIVAKQRDGKTGIVNLVYNASCTRFDSCANAADEFFHEQEYQNANYQ